jgi:hypothetical protein
MTELEKIKSDLWESEEMFTISPVEAKAINYALHLAFETGLKAGEEKYLAQRENEIASEDLFNIRHQ